MSIIIGIDHGYYAIKTAHCSFPAGLTSYGEHEPYTRQGLLEFGGCFFVCGSGRQPIQRDKTVMIMLAYTTGLRGCDIVNLKFDSIDWDACELRLVQEKTNIPVSLPLDTKTGNAIADYILHARPKCKSEYIFLRVLRPYTKIGSMWTVIAKYAHIALGKDRKMNGPHAFRRGMGRQLLEANIPAPLICDILGHSSSVSLRQYTASSLEKLKVCAGTISAIPIAQEALL